MSPTRQMPLVSGIPIAAGRAPAAPRCAVTDKGSDLRNCTFRREVQSCDWFDDSAQSVYEIRNFIEFKTTWHPIGA